MEPNIQPIFTDRNVLKFLNENWLFRQNSKLIRESIALNDSCLIIGFSFDSYPQLSLSFRDKYDGLIGSFTYSLQRSISDMTLIPRSVEVLFLESFGNPNSAFMTKSAAIELLLQYPDFKEWLLWNRP